MKRPVVMLVLGSFALITCSRSGTGDAGHSFRTEVGEDGVPVSITSMVPKYDQPLFRLVEEVHLRQDEQRPETLLFQAYQYFRGPDGNYYVMDRGNGRVAVFGSDGEFIRAFGREGDGPGEFRYPTLQRVDADGVIIFDSRSRRVMRFSLAGDLLETFAFPRSGYQVLRMTLGKGRIGMMSYDSERLPDGSYSQTMAITMVTLDGDTLGTVSAGRTTQPAPVRTEGGRLLGLSVHYAAYSQAMHYPGQGVLRFDGSQAEFQLYDTDCRLVRRYRIDAAAEPVTGVDREAVLAYNRKRLEEAEEEIDREFAKAELEHAVFADQKPFYNSVSLDEFGYFWVYPPRELATEVESDLMTVWLFSPEGEYLGDADLPTMTAGRSGIYLCTRKEDEQTGDYDYVVYRMESAVPGFVYP